jgi:hypothetical protein
MNKRSIRSLRWSRAASGGLLLLVAVSCASTTGDSFETPPELVPPAVDEPVTGQSEPVTSSGSEDGEASRDALSVVIEDEQTADETSTKSLVLAAQRERERRRQAPQPKIVITDDNLAEYATGELTVVVDSGDREEEETPTEVAADAGVGETADEEAYWRDRIRQARMNWSMTLQEIEHLEDRVAELRRRFYEEDDPFYRDTQIKPSWDQSLDRLEEARDAAEESRLRVQEILEEGRRAGALPGWLREGVELEPESVETSPAHLPEHEIREPETVEPREPDGGDG